MAFSSGKSKQSTSTSNESSNVNLQNSGDGTALAVRDAGTINIADPGGFELGRQALDNARDMLDSVVDLAGRVLGGQSDSLQRAYDFADDTRRDTFDVVRGNTQDVLEFAENRSEDQQDFFASVLEGALGFVRDVQSEAQSMLGTTVSTLNAIANENSKSGDQRIGEIAAGSQKTILIALGIIGAVGAAFLIFRRG